MHQQMVCIKNKIVKVEKEFMKKVQQKNKLIDLLIHKKD